MMAAPRWLRRLGALSFSDWLLRLIYVGLGAWAVGIAMAGLALDSWRGELSRTLLQLNADAQFRARAHNRDAVDPEWYRRKALSLLAATERLQHDALWTTFIPGSWREVDNLEEQVQVRLEREFSDIVVETMRRELYAKAAKLTGVPVAHGAGDLQMGAECQSPVPQNLERKLTGAAEDLPEFVAVTDYVAGIERLDAAVQSFLSLQSGHGDAGQLRKLVAFTLGKDLPGALAGAVRMFPGSEEVNIQPALMQSRMQWAARCSLLKGMSALHTRLLNTNDLFALEQGYVERSSGLFESPARTATFDRTLERYRAVRALLDDQDALLAKGRNDWMGQGTLKLGPAYQQVVQKVERTQLLGREVVQQLQNQSGAAFLEFRRQFEQAFGSQGTPGIVWIEGEKRFGLSTEREALRAGLGALLQTSFMSDDAARNASDKPARDNVTLAKVTQEARALADERTRAIDTVVPRFPERAQPVVTRVIDARVSELIYQRAFRTLKASLPVDPKAPLDTAAFRRQREQVVALQGVLKETGGSGLGDRLVATLDSELLRRLAVIQEDWNLQPMQDPKLTDFSWWHGEALPLAQTLGASDGGSAAPSLARTATHLDLLVQQARALLALGSPGLSTDPAATRWLRLQGELDRYATHASDSSLVRLERYVAALGPDLKRENCTERLSANAPTGLVMDDISRRHLQLHNALANRCNELRAAQAGSLMGPMPQ